MQGMRKTLRLKARYIRFFIRYCITIPFFVYYYLKLLALSPFKQMPLRGKVCAIVLSWKRTINLPLVVSGLKKQSFIDDVIVYHNDPSWLRVPGCKNIFSKTNDKCIIRHELAATLPQYDYFVFSDDDLMMTRDLSSEVLPVLDKYGAKSVLGFYGRNLNDTNRPYTTGIEVNKMNEITSVDIVKGRLHIISQTGVQQMAQSGLESPALRSEDDIRANIALQRIFKKPSYLIPLKRGFIDLSNAYARELRQKHTSLRDRAILDGMNEGWKPIRGQSK